MKQLINIANPNIKIIAEEFEEQLGGYMLTTDTSDTSYYSFQEWILSDYEEPKGDKVEPIIKDDRTVGVKIPIINKAIYFADIKENINWDDAVKYAKSLGKKIPTYRELCILAYYRKEIEGIYPKFQDLEYIWGEQYSAYYAWYLDGNGTLTNYAKSQGFSVVPLADLPKQPQLTKFEQAVYSFYTEDSNGKLKTKEELRERAKRLFELAKQELEKETDRT